MSAVRHCIEREQQICLTMIVKNEAHIIRRCLDSVKTVITRGVVCDTGSSDGTQDAIRLWSRESGVPIEVYDRPWVDFAANRTEAFELARGKGDYFLVFDADETLEAPETETQALPRLSSDAYAITSRTFIGESCPRLVLFNAALPWRYGRALHEYPVPLEGRSLSHLAGLVIQDHRDGGRMRTSDRGASLYVDLARKAVATSDPELVYDALYNLGRAYFVAGRWEEAIGAFGEALAEITDGSTDPDARYRILFQTASAMAMRGGPCAAVVDAYLCAWEARPTRAEPLRLAAQICERDGCDALAVELDWAAAQLPMSNDRMVHEPSYGPPSLVALWGSFAPTSESNAAADRLRASWPSCRDEGLAA